MNMNKCKSQLFSLANGFRCFPLKAIFLSVLLIPLVLVSNAFADELVIAGPCDPSLANEYCAENPDVAITLNDAYFDSAEKLIDAMIFQESNFDIMILWTQNQDIETLMERGYCPSLDASQVIVEQVNQMYPSIKDAVTYNGHLYALPLSAYCAEMAYLPDVFDAAGVEVPHSFEDIAMLINSWEDQPEEVIDSYQIAEYIEEYGSWFLLRCTERYINTMKARGDALTFDTEEYRSLLALQSALSDAADFNDAIDDLTPLIYSGQDVTMNPKLRLLPIQMGDSLTYRGAMYVAVINPYSAHQEEALRFLEWVALHTSDVSKLYMYPAANEPVENLDYQSAMEEWTVQRDELSAALEQCTEDQRKDLQTQLDEHLARLEQIEANRYLITADDIAAWKEAMEHMVFSSPSIYDLNEELFTELEFRYLDGQLPVDKLLTELERIAQMLLLESAE